MTTSPTTYNANAIGKSSTVVQNNQSSHLELSFISAYTSTYTLPFMNVNFFDQAGQKKLYVMVLKIIVIDLSVWT